MSDARTVEVQYVTDRSVPRVHSIEKALKRLKEQTRWIVDEVNQRKTFKNAKQRTKHKQRVQARNAKFARPQK